MHTKFGLSQLDFEKMVDEEQFTELAKKLQETLDKGKISLSLINPNLIKN